MINRYQIGVYELISSYFLRNLWLILPRQKLREIGS